MRDPSGSMTPEPSLSRVGTVPRSLVAVLALVLAAAGCARSGDPGSGASSTAAGRAANAAPPPVVLPGLTGLEPAVQDQIRARHAAVLALGGETGAPSAGLGDAYGELALLLQAAGFFRAAEDAYLNAQAHDPGAARWPYYLAHLYLVTGQRGRALERFRRVLDLEPDNLPALVWLGEMYLDQGQLVEAERVFDRALAVEPASPAVLAGIGRAAFAREDAARAVTYLERAIAVDPGRRASTTASAWRTGSRDGSSWRNSICGGAATERRDCPIRCSSSRPASSTARWPTNGADRVRWGPGGTRRRRRRFGPAWR